MLRGTLSTGSDRVKVVCNERTLLDVTGHAYAREPEQIHFGQNLIGGTSCGPILHGRVAGLDGGAIRGDALAALPLTVRMRDWARHFPHQVATTALLSLALVLCGGNF